MIRELVTGAALSMLAATALGADRVDVWVLLTQPPLASGVTKADAIKQQQQSVIEQLLALGAVELGRVSRVRNAVAVSIDPAKLADIKRIPSVRSVSPVRHIDREPPVSPPTR